MLTTARAASWLRSIPESDAVQLVRAVEQAHAALPTLAPGVRVILSGILWQLTTPAYVVNFGSIDNAPAIVAGRLAAAPKPRRKAGKAA